jgi:hypothetical protein
LIRSPGISFVGRRLAILMAMLLVIQGSAGVTHAQSKEWWDLHAEAVKIIESSSPSKKQLNSARRSLQAALRAKSGEGKFGTYNPSVREDYLPHFYLGWANLLIGRYSDATRSFKKSGDIGYINKGAPARLKKLFDEFSALVPQLEPASKAVASAKKNSLARQCQSTASSAAGKTIQSSLATIEAILNAPKAENASGLKSAIDSLQSAQADCAREVKGAIIAQLSGEFEAARDAVSVEGVGDFLGATNRKELEGAVQAGNSAAAQGDDDGLKKATARLKTLPGKLGADVDRQIATLAREAEKLSGGNVGALNAQGQLGTRLTNLASRTKTSKAAGKTGADLLLVVKAGNDLKSAIAEARQTLQPLLQAKSTALAAARKDFDSWSRARVCDIQVVNATADVTRAFRQADVAKGSGSADAFDQATQFMTSVKDDVAGKMKVALPRKEAEARGAIKSVEGLIAILPGQAKKARGGVLKSDIEKAVARKDACAIETAIASLNTWVGRESPALTAKKNAAVGRARPSLDTANSLIDGFGGILKGETVNALKGPVEELESLIKTSFDADAIDKAGQSLKPIVDRAQGEMKGQMQGGITAVKQMQSNDKWKTDVASARRDWLEKNLGAVERAVQSTSNPTLLARFAKEYPRARLELALVSAFDSLYKKDDPIAAVNVLEALGPGLRAGSAALNYSLAYCYWWQGRADNGSGRESLMQKAGKAFADGKALKVNLASLGAALFAPAFVEEMSAR